MMVLGDTSVWIDHFHRGEAALAALLEQTRVLMHPFVIGEIACGTLADRVTVLELLSRLPTAPRLGDEEVISFIESKQLMGRGIGYVDVHLLGSAMLAGAPLWSRDRRLATVAGELGVAFDEPGSRSSPPRG
jgi:predicted nucleic acid-binding protein